MVPPFDAPPLFELAAAHQRRRLCVILTKAPPLVADDKAPNLELTDCRHWIGARARLDVIVLSENMPHTTIRPRSLSRGNAACFTTPPTFSHYRCPPHRRGRLLRQERPSNDRYSYRSRARS